MGNNPEKPSWRPQSGYLHSLDGWRAIAIALVCFFHDRVHQGLFYDTSLLHKYGDRGVDLFFALSGILICSRLLEEERKFGRISLRNFYVRRLCRIQPAAFIYLFTVGILALFSLLPLSVGAFASAVCLFRNFYPFHGSLYDPSVGATNHFWSLSLEEHFYLFLPLFLVVVRKRRVRIVLVIVFGLFLWSVVARRLSFTQFGPLPKWRTDLRINSLLVPALFALILAHERARAIVRRWLNPYSAIALSLAFTLWQNWQMNSISSFAADLTFPLIVMGTMLNPTSAVTRLLELWPFRMVGRLSYSLYLWQQLVISRPAWIPGMQWWQIRYSVLLLLAVVSYMLVEKPFIRYGHRLAPPATPGRQDLQETGS